MARKLAPSGETAASLSGGLPEGMGPHQHVQVTRVGFKGNGQLRVGGNWGNKGGGTFTDQIRAQAQADLLPRIGILSQIADGELVVEAGEPTATERVRAIEVLQRIGMGDTISVSEIRNRLLTQMQVIRARAMWTADELIAELKAVWS